MAPIRNYLVAPAVFSLLVPGAAGAVEFSAATADRYASQDQVTSLSQFSDLRPTDWVYQALSNLTERYGCVAGYPDATYKGGRSMTRFEAAALLNACLDRVTEVTDELRKLMAEFEKELAVLKGRVDGLEAKAGELEATQFSTTTKLSGQATFVIGGVHDAPYQLSGKAGNFFQINGSKFVPSAGIPDGGLGSFYANTLAKDGVWNLEGLRQYSYGRLQESGEVLGFGGNSLLLDGGNPADLYVWKETDRGDFDGLPELNPAGRTLAGALSAGRAIRVAALQPSDTMTFNYDLRLNFDTSFTGKDLFRTQLRAGNASSSSFASGASQLEIFADQCEGLNASNGCSDGVNINRLFYQFPIGSHFRATVGAKVRQDDMLPMWPSVYPAESVLDIFTYAGAPGAYSLNLGAGLGLSWAKDGWHAGLNYVSDSLNAADSSSGLAEGFTATAQLGYTGKQWGLALAYTYGDNSEGGAGQLLGNGTSIANFLVAWPGSTTNSIGLSAYWQPDQPGWVPSVSAGLGYTHLDTGDFVLGSYDLWSWSIGLQWSDVAFKDNSLGVAVGMPTFVSDASFTSPTAVEAWYRFQVTDQISITPAIFWIQDGAYGVDPQGGSSPDDSLGAVVKTTFKF